MQWEKFLSSHGIEYVTAGPNTKRGEISIRCPWCGDDDPSQHLGISLSKDVWGCHRNNAHRGKSPVRLVAALLGCSMSTAQLTLKQYTQNDPDDLEQAIAMLTEEEKPVEEEPLKVEWPKEFHTIRGGGERFARYLEQRGFSDPFTVGDRYNLRCASTGRYKDRIIFPLYLNNELVGWTARAITDPIKAPRYLASSKGAKMTVYGYERAQKGGHALFIVEGPFDALKINTVADTVRKSVDAVAIMGTTITIPQLAMLRALVRKHKRSFVHLDMDAIPQGMKIANDLNCEYTVEWNETRGFESKDLADTPCFILEDLVKAACAY